MVYQFGQDYSGKVVAEDKAEGLSSWLNHHFPASDIPIQARELYLRNRIRSIPNVDYVPAPILPSAASLEGEPLDLSGASLRSVSPVHLQYLRNMRVAASMSVSIVKDGRLWGLIACHHGIPRHTSTQVRFAFDFLGQTLALLIGSKEESAHLENAAELNRTHLRLLRHISDQADVLKGLVSSPDDLMALAGASGAAMCIAGRCMRLGMSPSHDQVLRLVAWLSERDSEIPFATDALPACYPEAIAYADRTAGVLAVPLGVDDHCFLIWFRPEILREILWAGNPDNPAEPLTGESRVLHLHPRKSFETWKKTVAGTSAPWMPWEVEAAEALAEELSRILLLERAAVESAGRRAAEAERDRLRDAAAAMEQVLGVIGHELRTPLAAVGAIADLLINPQARQMSEFDTYVTSVKTEIKRMSDTLNNLIDAARLASGHGAWVWTTVSLEFVCQEALDAVRPSISSAAVEMRLTVKSPELSMSGDADALRRMLINLLENAREHTPQGAIELACGSMSDAAGSWVEFCVSDTGKGIAPELANRLGQAFSMNAGVVGINLIRGSGLGLGICRGIAAAHGGRILIESVQGSGTKVSVRIRADLPGPALASTDVSISTVIT
jgi:light-regulated signal transduction histidine kinase (bacteriophytochrome)